LGLGQALGDVVDQVQGLKTAKKIFAAIDSAEGSTIDGLANQKGAVPLYSTVEAVRAEEVDVSAHCLDLNTVDKEQLYELTGQIELRDVCFTYPSRPDVPVCKRYNLTIQPGEVIAFVGPSGSGKVSD
jgi:ABC-type multidrug transport system fused ATPase/permease subunit